VGLSLIPSALNDNIFEASGNIYQNIELAVITMVALLLSITIGTYLPKLQKIFKIGSIVIALMVGTIVASFKGLMDWSTVLNADWFSLPKFTALHYGINFNLSAIITFIIIFVVLTTETTGTWFAMSAVTKEKISNKQWNHGIIGEGMSCLVSALLGSTPMTGYSTNAGVVSITGVASRRVFVAAGFWFILLGFFGKLSALLAAIPAAVVGGVFAVIVVIIMLSGLNVIGDLNMTGNKGYIIGVPIVMTLALVFLPDKVINDAPQMIQYLLGSPITVAAVTAVILNLVLNKKEAKSAIAK
jgi:NCS2 family nucleobase:cation symporter-2